MIGGIGKKLMKSDKGLSRGDAEKKARGIWDSYCEANKERDAKREEEREEAWERALDMESFNLEAEYSSGD